MVALHVNGRPHRVDVTPDTPLLWALRDALGLTGTKYGCGMALGGACTVHLDGQPVRARVTPVSAAAQKEDHHHRSDRHGPGCQGRANGVGRARRTPVRLLPARPDHVRRGTPQAKT